MLVFVFSCARRVPERTAHLLLFDLRFEHVVDGDCGEPDCRKETESSSYQYQSLIIDHFTDFNIIIGLIGFTVFY